MVQLRNSAELEFVYDKLFCLNFVRKNLWLKSDGVSAKHITETVREGYDYAPEVSREVRRAREVEAGRSASWSNICKRAGVAIGLPFVLTIEIAGAIVNAVFGSVNSRTRQHEFSPMATLFALSFIIAGVCDLHQEALMDLAHLDDADREELKKILPKALIATTICSGLAAVIATKLECCFVSWKPPWAVCWPDESNPRSAGTASGQGEISSRDSLLVNHGAIEIVTHENPPTSAIAKAEQSVSTSNDPLLTNIKVNPGTCTRVDKEVAGSQLAEVEVLSAYASQVSEQNLNFV